MQPPVLLHIVPEHLRLIKSQNIFGVMMCEGNLSSVTDAHAPHQVIPPRDYLSKKSNTDLGQHYVSPDKKNSSTER